MMGSPIKSDIAIEKIDNAIFQTSKWLKKCFRQPSTILQPLSMNFFELVGIIYYTIFLQQTILQVFRNLKERQKLYFLELQLALN
jgi:hypothetical protein